MYRLLIIKASLLLLAFGSNALPVSQNTATGPRSAGVADPEISGLKTSVAMAEGASVAELVSSKERDFHGDGVTVSPKSASNKVPVFSEDSVALRSRSTSNKAPVLNQDAVSTPPIPTKLRDHPALRPRFHRAHDMQEKSEPPVEFLPWLFTLGESTTLPPLPFLDVWERLSEIKMPGTEFIKSSRATPDKPEQTKTLSERWQGLVDSASTCDWLFLGISVSLLLLADTYVMQQLPETERSHILLVVFWFLVTCSYNLEVWLQMGPAAGRDWLSGYFMELMFSSDNIILLHFVVNAFAMPRRLMGKAMFAVMVGSIATRTAYLLGLANIIGKCGVLSYIFGGILLYLGLRQIALSGDIFAMMQKKLLKTLRVILGNRFGEFYDEDGEGIFASSGQVICMTLLGVAISCMLIVDFAASWDVGVVKPFNIANGYVSLSSSVFAVFTMRAIFFVVKDMMNRFALLKYGAGMILAFLGTETLLAGCLHVDVLSSTMIVLSLVAFTSIVSGLHDSWGKKQPARWS